VGTDFNVGPAGAPALQPANDAIVDRVADNRTSLVLQPFPDQAVLRRRTYFRALNLAKRAPTRLLVTDRMA
jgi:hypothetical protein